MCQQGPFCFTHFNAALFKTHHRVPRSPALVKGGQKATKQIRHIPKAGKSSPYARRKQKFPAVVHERYVEDKFLLTTKQICLCKHIRLDRMVQLQGAPQAMRLKRTNGTLASLPRSNTADEPLSPAVYHSTVTDLAKFLGLSTSLPLQIAA